MKNHVISIDEILPISCVIASSCSVEKRFFKKIEIITNPITSDVKFDVTTDHAVKMHTGDINKAIAFYNSIIA